nr:ABC transporter substrate-binding protein [Gammaproteobacteria bacterium]
MVRSIRFIPKQAHQTLGWTLRLFLVSLVALALVFAGKAVEGKEAAGRAASVDPRALIEGTTAALLAAFKREQTAIRNDPTHAYAIVDELLSPHIDYDRVARLILGKYWRQTSPEQRQRFINEFRELQVRTYATAVLDYADVDVRYLPTRQPENADRAMVRTQIPRRNGIPVSVDYRLHRADGRWQVYDVLVEGVSLLTNYRASVGAQIAQIGIEGVIERIGAQNREAVPPGQ